MNARPTYPVLDTVRAIAALAVLLTHVGFWSGVYYDGLLGAATQRLDAGVAVFFVLSGFLLSRPAVAHAADGSRRDSVGRYLVKRAVRILPVYWVCVILALTLLPENRGLSFERWANNLLLVDQFRSGALPDGLTQMWSLSVEVMFYLLLPLVAVLLARGSRGEWRPGRILLVLGIVGVGAALWAGYTESRVFTISPWLDQGLLQYLDWFAAGIAIAVIDVDRRLDNPRLVELARPVIAAGSSPGSCWLLAAAVFAVASTPLAGPVDFQPGAADQAVVRNLLYLVAATLVVLTGVFARPGSLYHRVMSHGVPRHLGHISYGLFCCHVIVLELIFLHLPLTLFEENVALVLAITLSISLIVSELLYRLVERPAMRLIRPGRPPAPASSAASPATTSS